MGYRFYLAALAVVTLLPANSLAQGVVLGDSPASDAAMLEPDGLASAIEALPQIAREAMDRTGLPGLAIGVVHGQETVFLDGFGVAKVGTERPVTPDTVFQIASISKSISATIAAIAVSRGAIDWDDPIAHHLPNFSLSDPYIGQTVTIGDMFAHRSGLPFAAGDALEDLGFERGEIIARLGQLPLDDFRHSYHYANFGITTGAQAIAQALDTPW